MTSPREQTRAPLADSNAKKRKRGAGGGSEWRRRGKLPWRSRPCKEAARCALGSGTSSGRGEGPPGGPWPAPRQRRWGGTHIVLGGVPPLLHVHHGGVLHAVGEHLPPQSEWRPPAASPSHPGRAPAPSAPRVPAATRHFVPAAAARAPSACRYGTGALPVPEGARAPCAPGGSPRACRAPCAPAPPPPPLSGSPARSLRRPVGPAGTGGAEEGRGCVPPAGTGRGPRSALSARWGGTGGAPSPHSGSGGLGAGGGCGRRRRRQGQAGREGRGGEGRQEGKRAGRGSGPGGGARGGGEGAAAQPERPGGPARPRRAQSAVGGLARPWATSRGP